MHTVEISDETHETAKRIATLDGIDVETLIQSLVLRHAEYIDMLQEASSERRPFSLDSRQARSTAELTDEEMGRIRMAKTPAGHDYDYEEDPVTPQRPGGPP